MCDERGLWQAGGVEGNWNWPLGQLQWLDADGRRTTAENNNSSSNKNITFVPSLIHHLFRASPNLPFNGRTLLFIVYQLREKQNPNNSAGNAHILYSLQYLTPLFRLATNAL